MSIARWSTDSFVSLTFRLGRATLLRFACFAAFVLASAATLEQPAFSQSAQAQAGSRLEAGDLHLNSSRVYIHVFKTGFGHEHAVIGQLQSGKLDLSGKTGGKLVFDMTSFAADTDAARKYLGLEGTTDASTQEQVNDNMLGADILNVQRFPTATFTLKSLTPVAEKSRRGLPQVQLDGEFMLHGVKKSVRIVADVEAKDSWRRVRGGFAVNQSDYGITPFRKALGTIGVADRLEIFGDFWVADQAMDIPAGR